MLKHAPTVYIPHQPDDDGIALPTILSMVVHSAIIAFILYAHHVPNIEMPPAIETSIVTPAELAAMQAAVLDNRESLAQSGAQAAQRPSNESFESPAPMTSTADDDNQPQATVTDKMRRRVPVIFSKSTDDADRFEPVDKADAEMREALAKRRETKKQAMEAFNRQQMDNAASKIENYNDDVDADYLKELEKLEAFKKTEKNPVKPDKPKRVDVTVPPSLNSNKVKANGSNGKTITLGEGSNQSPSKEGGASGSADSTPSASSIKGALVAHIRPYWHPPSGRIGKSLKATIKVDENGNVQSVSANSDDAALNRSLEQAIKDASPLTPVVGTKFRTIPAMFVVAK